MRRGISLRWWMVLWGYLFSIAATHCRCFAWKTNVANKRLQNAVWNLIVNTLPTVCDLCKIVRDHIFNVHCGNVLLFSIWSIFCCLSESAVMRICIYATKCAFPAWFFVHQQSDCWVALTYWCSWDDAWGMLLCRQLVHCYCSPRCDMSGSPTNRLTSVCVDTFFFFFSSGIRLLEDITVVIVFQWQALRVAQGSCCCPPFSSLLLQMKASAVHHTRSDFAAQNPECCKRDKFW